MKLEILIDGIVKTTDSRKRIVFDKPDYYQKQVSTLPDDQKVSVVIKNKTKKRSLGQNAYWHAVCFPVIGELMGETSGEAKAICKAKFILPKIKVDPQTKKELEIPRGSSELDAYEGWEFTTAMMELAHFLGGKILTPCEAGYVCGRRNCDVCAAKIQDSGVEYPVEDIDPDKILF